MPVLGPFRQMPEAEPKTLESIDRINTEIEREVSARLISEKMLESYWSQARRFEAGGRSYWLLLVRLTEAALLCAGNYADNCEFEAAGDFLVNPRKILVHQPTARRPTVKRRHGRLTEQFGLAGTEPHRFKRLYSANFSLEITKPPLLPHMTQVLRSSQCVSTAYIRHLEKGQRRIADALTFLAAWRIFDSAQLRRRLQAASAQESAFAESNLCRFDARVFHRIGVSLQRSLAEPDYRSSFLSAPHSAAIL